MCLVVIDADEYDAVVAEQFFQQLQPRIHHAAPLVVAAGVFAFFADGLADPFLELRLGEVVVVDPAFVAGVVRRVDVDALDPCRRGSAAAP